MSDNAKFLLSEIFHHPDSKTGVKFFPSFDDPRKQLLFDARNELLRLGMIREVVTFVGGGYYAITPSGITEIESA